MELDPRLGDGHGGDSMADEPYSASSESPSSQPETSAYPNPPGLDPSLHPRADSDHSSTPLSTGQHHGDPSSHHPDGDANDPKKARACEACRGLKVRCEPDPADEAGPCKRCRKAGRNCVVTAPTRKRQKKTDSRVAELEKKIDLLTASLQSRAGGAGVGAGPGHGLGQGHAYGLGNGLRQGQGQGGFSPDQASSASPTGTARPASDDPSGYGMVWGNGATRHWSTTAAGGGQRRTDSPSAPVVGAGAATEPSQPPPLLVVAGQKRKASDRRDTLDDERRKSASATPSASAFRSQDGDVVERGIISMDAAADLFRRYNEHMVQHFPAVIFPPSVTVAELRRTRPVLFLAITASASGENHAVQRVLQKELMQVIADKVLMAGEKNLELVQAILVASIWYWPPEHFEELKYYQLVHIAAVMALDIGLGRKTQLRRQNHQSVSWREHPFTRRMAPDPTTLESRRTWLTCHFLATNAAMSLHRPILFRWSPFMTESVDILETSPDAAPTDLYFCQLVRTHCLAEEVLSQFSVDDPSSNLNITDPRTQYSLRSWERDMDKIRAAVGDAGQYPMLRFTLDVVALFMNERALQSETSTDQFRPPFNADALKDGIINSSAVSSAHVKALSACLKAIDGVFQTFLSFDVPDTRCLPVYAFVRVAYSIVILLKMYFSASSSSSEMGKVINKESMRVNYYIDALIHKFRVAATDDKCRPAAKFLVVLAMLRSWFLKQGAAAAAAATPDHQKPGPSPATSDRASPRVPASQQQPPKTANTPLQLLSEVATGRDSTPARPLFQPVPGLRHHQQQSFFPTSNSPTDTPPHQHQHQHQQQQHLSLGAQQGLPAMTSSDSGASNATMNFDPDLTAAMAPAMPSSWISTPGGGGPADLNMSGPGGGFDFDGAAAFVPQGEGVYEDGARLVMNEPWFMDVFHGMSGPSNWPF